MANLAFISDPHLGYRHRFKRQRLEDYRRCFEQAVDKALSQEPDAVIVLGDLTHHPKPDPVTMRSAISGLLRISKICPAIVCIGNHEISGHLSTAYTPIWEDLSKNIRVLTTHTPYADIKAGSKTYRFCGFEYTRSPKTAQENLKKAKSHAVADVNILCLHQAVEGYISPHEISLASLSDAAEAFDLVMLGHLHKHRRLKSMGDKAPCYYCGSTERVSFNEAENKTGIMVFKGDDFFNPVFLETDSATMKKVRQRFDGTVQNLNDKVKSIISESPQSLLRIELYGVIEGDLTQIRREYGPIAKDKKILDVIVEPESKAGPATLSRMSLSEDLIREYFEKTDMDSDLLETCLSLYRRYAS